MHIQSQYYFRLHMYTVITLKTSNTNTYYIHLFMPTPSIQILTTILLSLFLYNIWMWVKSGSKDPSFHMSEHVNMVNSACTSWPHLPSSSCMYMFQFSAATTTTTQERNTHETDAFFFIVSFIRYKTQAFFAFFHSHKSRAEHNMWVGPPLI